MNYDYLDKLVFEFHKGNPKAKEEIIKEFTPFIINLSKRTYIKGYTFDDIKNECYHSLLYALNKYKIERHSFVGYALNAIRNNLNHLIKKELTHLSHFQDISLLSDDAIYNIPEKEEVPLDELINHKLCSASFLSTIKNLNNEDKELIHFVFISGNTLTSYSEYKNEVYHKSRYKMNRLLKKLKQSLALNHIYSMSDYKDII